MALSCLWEPHAMAKLLGVLGKERVAVLDTTASNGTHQNGTRNGGVHTQTNGHSETSNGTNGSANGHRGVHVNGNGAVRSTNSSTEEAAPKTKIIHRYPVVRTLFTMGSIVGEEVFFIFFLPLMFWNFDFFIGRRVVLLWFYAVYTGTALKDKLRWDRPDGEIVMREVHDDACQEFGMPSTHTASGAILTTGLIYESYFRYEFPLLPAVLIATPLILCMGLSRVYSGHHTPLDVLGALGLVAAVLVAGGVCAEPLDNLYMSPSLLGPLSVAMTVAIAFFIYPHPPIIRNSSKDMPIIVGVFAGFYLGLWLTVGGINPADARHLEPYQLPSPDKAEMIAGVLRYVCGVLILFVMRMSLKVPSLWFFSTLLADPSKGPAKEQLRVFLWYRLVTYGGTCMACITLGPLCFISLGIPVQTS